MDSPKLSNPSNGAWSRDKLPETRLPLSVMDDDVARYIEYEYMTFIIIILFLDGGGGSFAPLRIIQCSIRALIGMSLTSNPFSQLVNRIT